MVKRMPADDERAPRVPRTANAGSRLAAIIIAAVLLSVWLYPNPPAAETRPAAQAPNVGLETAASAELFRELDRAALDRLGLKKVAVPLVGELSAAAGVSLQPQVVMSPGGEPFLSEDFVLP